VQFVPASECCSLLPLSSWNVPCSTHIVPSDFCKVRHLTCSHLQDVVTNDYSSCSKLRTSTVFSKGVCWSCTHDAECVQGGMMATLSYLSFLPDVVQRTAVTTAAAMAARASSDTMSVALEVVPHLLNLLEDCKDVAILNSACSALHHITSAASRSARLLKQSRFEHFRWKHGCLVPALGVHVSCVGVCECGCMLPRLHFRWKR
jgi:hypothetical protein